MEFKTARLTLLIDPNKKEAFERLCALQDRTASQVVRQLIRDYLAQHGVHDIARDATPSSDVATPRTESGAPEASLRPPSSALRTPRPPAS